MAAGAGRARVEVSTIVPETLPAVEKLAHWQLYRFAVRRMQTFQ